MIAAAALALAGCGQAPPRAATVATIVVSEPADAPEGDRPPHYDENHRYRERVPVAASAQRVLDAARADVTTRLAALPDPPTLDAVTTVVAATGDYPPWVAADGHGGFAFESEVGESGCLIGTVAADGAPSVETGGFVMDGGCHALTGH